jgi:hypothetical protein
MKKLYLLEIDHEDDKVVDTVLIEFLDEWLGRDKYELIKYGNMKELLIDND